eukprot:scaffold873_cov393-Prasinococcus_capsulatus_cf.AAC.11
MVPFSREFLPTRAELLTSVADAAIGKKSEGNNGVINSNPLATSSSADVMTQKRFGSWSNSCPPRDPTRSVASDPKPSLRTHLAAAAKGTVPACEPRSSPPTPARTG